MTGKKSPDCRTALLSGFLLFLSVVFNNIAAQNYFFDYYGIEHGLNISKVYATLQDSRGFVWLATPIGVSRFDGRSFINYTSGDGLAVNGVRCIAKDPDGNIWFGHLFGGGVSRFNGKYFEEVAFDSLEFNGDVTSISFINDTAIWITTEYDGALLAKYPVKDIKHIEVKQFKGNDISDQVVGSAILRSGDIICITADAGLRKYNAAEEKFENYRMPHLTTDSQITSMFDDSRGDIWFGTFRAGLYKYHLSESRMEYIDLIKEGMESNTITSFMEDRRGRIWVGTWGGGLAMFDGEQMTIFDEKNGLSSTGIFDIKEDVEGNILIADETNGLIIYKGDGLISIGDQILFNPNVSAVYKDRTGSLWFGSGTGITRFTPWSGSSPVLYNYKNNSIPQNITFFREDRDGNLWIGTKDGGVVKYDFSRSAFGRLPINDDIYEGQVKALEIDSENNIWIGTLGGFLAVRPDGETYLDIEMGDSVVVKEITALHCDRNGFMWIGTANPGGTGLIKYDPVSKRVDVIDSLTNIIPRALLLDSSGDLMIGTDDGLLIFRKGRIERKIKKKDGLLSDNINLLTEADDGSIFIGTNAGLNRYFPESGRIISYTEKNGFTGISTNPGAVYKADNGEIWIGTVNGAVMVRPDRLISTGIEPLTHISAMRINDLTREMLPGMKLKYRENKIVFGYYSICLINPDVVKYQIKLEGLDREWQLVTDTTAKYSALPPGHYNFMVKASNSFGYWNEKPVEFQYIIKPPFYFSPWFIASVVIILISLVVSYIKIRERNLVIKNRVLETKVAERTAEVVQKSQIIEEKNRDITASIRYAERIQRAMLPKVEEFAETFVLFMPKDIVSGDFYWMYDEEDKILIATVDCTGHGVPGAFMSIIGHNSLNKVVREYGIIKPSEILRHLDAEVTKSIIQSQEKGITDGMDLALIAFDRNKFTLEFAGAYNPLYLVRNSDVKVYKGDRFPIGMTSIPQKKSFTNIDIEVRPGDMLYMCTDGYADQFGSASVKKFKTVNIKKLLSDICDLPLQEQKNRLEREILDWKGDLSQVDDILFVGMRIKG